MAANIEEITENHSDEAPTIVPKQSETFACSATPLMVEYTTPQAAQPVPQGAPPPMMPPPVRMTGIPEQPNKDAESGDGGEKPQFANEKFNDIRIRKAFVRKVYVILSAQLLVTSAFVAFFLFHEPTKNWIQTDGFWFYYVSYFTFFSTYIALACVPSLRRKSPTNFVCLAVFTLSLAYMTGTIASYYDTSSVLIAALVTALVCVSITVFAIQTKIDFTMRIGLIFCLSMVLFFVGWSCFMVWLCFGGSYVLQCIYGGLAALLFSLFLAFDTQMLLGGRNHELSEEEYIFAALQLYLDVVYLFLIILRLFGGGD